MKELYEEEHESYGLIKLDKIYSGPKTLFASDVKHSKTISLSIIAAKKYIDSSGQTKYTTNKQHYIKVEMSYAQFSEMLIDMNYNNGVPCTIRKINDEYLENPPEANNKISDYELAFLTHNKKTIDEFNNIEDRVKKMIEKGKGNKTELKELVHDLSVLHHNMNSDLKYYEKVFRENMESIVNEKKLEIKSFLSDNKALLEKRKNIDLLE